MQGPSHELMLLLQHIRAGKTNEQLALDLIKHNPGLLSQNYQSITPLLAVASMPSACSLDFFAVLSQPPSDINATNAKGVGAIHLLAQRNHFELLKDLLLTKGLTNLNAKTHDGHTALFLATLSGSHQALALLIDAGADCELKNKLGRAPLHIACQRGDEVAVSLLLAIGANVDSLDNEGRTPAHFLTSANDGANKELILEMLAARGAALQIKSKKGNEPWQLAQSSSQGFAKAMQAKRVPSLLQLSAQQLTAEQIENLAEEILEKISKLTLNKNKPK